MSDPEQKRFRRIVFYIPGYDPMSARRYRELYRAEGAKQAAISGYKVAVQGVTGAGEYRWRVHYEGPEGTAETLFCLCAWNDLVRGSMARSIPGIYGVMLRTSWTYIASGAFGALLRLRAAPMLAAVYPVVMLLAQAGLALALAVWVMGATPSLWLGVPLGLGAGTALLVGFRRLDTRIFAYYLMTDYAFSAQLRGATPPQMEAREAEFAARIRAALDGGMEGEIGGPVDEVLVIGHSSGAHVGVGVVARLLAAGPVPARPALSFLSLGQVIPMVSFLPKATALRRDLRVLARTKVLCWVDVTAPGDGACFALSDPVHVSGVAPPPADKHNPKILSAAFSHTLSRQTAGRTRFQFFRRHIQYLCAFDRPGWYDYFQVSAGPKTLDARYGARGATASRIETPLSPFRDV
ncbi:MAG: hypothetical protein AAFR93_04460 [Pseudomonadota bacterium]